MKRREKYNIMLNDRRIIIKVVEDENGKRVKVEGDIDESIKDKVKSRYPDAEISFNEEIDKSDSDSVSRNLVGNEKTPPEKLALKNFKKDRKDENEENPQEVALKRFKEKKKENKENEDED